MERKCLFKVFFPILSNADLAFNFTIMAIIAINNSNQRAKAMIGRESSSLAVVVRTLQRREQYIKDYHCLIAVTPSSTSLLCNEKVK